MTSQSSASTPSDLQSKALTVSRIYFQNHLKDHNAQEYLKQRQLSARMLRKFEIGYAPGAWRGLVDHFSSHKVRLAAKDAGVLTTPAESNRLLDFFRNRLMFPIRCQDGDLVGYGGRILPGADSEAPKYINTPETDRFNKSQLLYGLHQHKDSIVAQKSAIIVEGYMDVIRLSDAGDAGLDIAVAPMGTAITPEQIDLLFAHGVRKMWFCLDGDKAGESATERTVETIMQQYHPTLEVMLIHLPDGHDPDSMLLEHGPAAFKQMMQKAMTLHDYLHTICTQNLSPNPSIEEKASYLVRMQGFIEQSSGTLQARLLHQASQFTGLSVEEINASEPQRSASKQVASWHPNVCLAARWLMFDEDRQALIAKRLSELKDKSPEGLSELGEMASCLLNGNEPDGLLADYALAHGELDEVEMKVLAKQWSRWLDTTLLNSSLNTLSSLPFDSTAKQEIRSILRPG